MSMDWWDKLPEDMTPSDLAQWGEFKRRQAQEEETRLFQNMPREKQKARQRRWRLAHKEHVAAYYKEHKEQMKARVKRWRREKAAKRADAE